jgi:hypothetical protein
LPSYKYISQRRDYSRGGIGIDMPSPVVARDG